MTKDAPKPQTPDAVPAGHNEVTYPREIPTHSVGHIISHLRKQEVLPLPDLIQHVATVVGCGAEFMKSSPSPIGSSGPEQPYGDPKTLSDEAIADILESESKAMTAPQSSVDPAGAFPVWLIPILLDVVRRYFGF